MNQSQFSLAILGSYAKFPASFQLQYSFIVWSDGGNIISSGSQSISPAISEC